MKNRNDIAFKDLTTFKIGGAIDTYRELNSLDEVIEALAHTPEKFFLIGGGSNILARDEPYLGTVYKVTAKQVSHREENESVYVYAEAGVVWDELVKYVVEKGWWGFENLSAIPGTIGGALFQNIGAYGAVLSEMVVSVSVYDLVLKKTRVMKAHECLFGYRTSIFKQEKPRFIILSAEFRLKKNAHPNVAYRDLAIQFAQDPSPRLHAVRTAVCMIRKKKFPDWHTYGTAGSFFLNPIVSQEEAARFQETYPDMPLFSLPEGGIKIPLAWILDNVIDAKKMRVGGAFVWHAQALVLAADEGASAHEVRTLASHIQKKVFEKTRITIFSEVHVM
jgi:UDP-N-acetylmuramate dehydrogenase